MKLTTDRLVLTPVTEADGAILLSIINNEFVRKFLFDDEILSSQQVTSFIMTSISLFQKNKYGLWLIRENKLNEPIGFAGLWHFFDELQPQLLYALLPEYTGQGLATEACREILNYGFKELRFSYLTASTDISNTTSHKTAERLGMVKIKEKIIDDKPIVFYKIENISP